MHFQFIVAPPTPGLMPPTPPATESSAELLRQILEVQREQLGLMQVKPAESEGNAARWRSFFERWREDFPHLPAQMHDVLPVVEHAYVRLMDELVRQLNSEDAGGLEDDFSLGEFLDRFAIRANQLATILHMLGQMAEASRTEQSDGT
jgi:hypothetical protein